MNKLIVFVAVLLIVALQVSAQEDKTKRPSPPATFDTSVNGLKVIINYGQPSLKGRIIGKEIAPYGQVWRTGANEATTFEINRDVMIESKVLKAGKYTLFTIPGESEWTIIFNKQLNQWGAYKYDPNQDVLRVTVKSGFSQFFFSEQMAFTYYDNKISLLWGYEKVDFTIQ